MLDVWSIYKSTSTTRRWKVLSERSLHQVEIVPPFFDQDNTCVENALPIYPYAIALNVTAN